MATTTIASTGASRSGVRLFGRRGQSEDLLALLVLLALTVLGLMAGYARRPNLALNIDGLEVRPHLLDFHEPEISAGSEVPSYRWTQDESTIVVPGLGRGLWQSSLRLSSPLPEGRPKRVLVETGKERWVVQLAPEARTYHLLTPTTGDLRLALNVPAESHGADPRPLGVMFFGVTFQPGTGSPVPPVSLLVHSLVAVLLVFLTIRLIGVPPWPALLAPLAGLALLAWGIAMHRAPVGVYSVRLIGLSLVGLLLMAALRSMLPRLFRLGGVEVEPRVLSGLLLVVYGSYLLKAAGLLWPYFLAIDIEWHMEKTRRVLNGRIGELWRADSPFHQSVMPELWGENKPVIPYSPFYHIFSSIWAIFPWQLETSANVYSTVLDALRPAMIFFVVRRFGFRDRAALIAALTYCLIPATFLMHAWGNTPTTNGMWWSLLSIAALAGTWDRLHASRRAFIVLTATLMVTMLFYAVTAVFTTLLVLGVVVGLALTGRRRDARPLFLSLVTAILLSTGIYYWQFIGPIIARTIPKFTGAVAEGGKELGLEPITVPEFFWKYVYFFDIYGMYLPFGLGLAGWWLGMRRWGRTSLFGLLMTSWLVIALIFWGVGFRVDMVDKQLFWLMPWMGIGTGIAVDRLLDNKRAVRWAVPLLGLAALYVGSDALYLWIHRLHNYRGELAFVSWFQLLRTWL